MILVLLVQVAARTWARGWATAAHQVRRAPQLAARPEARRAQSWLASYENGEAANCVRILLADRLHKKARLIIN